MLELRAGDATCAIETDCGGRLSSLVVGGRERLLGRPPGDDVAGLTTWGCFPMAPWPGRLRNARFSWRGRELELFPNLPPHAIHGVCFDEWWNVTSVSEEGVVLGCAFDRKRWPLGGRVEQRVSLQPGSLRLEMIVSADEQAMPAACGWHPWFARPHQSDVSVLVDSDRCLETHSDLIPTGNLVPASGDADLRSGPMLGGRRLDTVYAQVGAPAVIRWPDLEMTIHLDRPLETVVVYTPEEGFCVEPQSAWPDAFNLAVSGVEGTGAVELEPGESVIAVTTWSWTP